MCFLCPFVANLFCALLWPQKGVAPLQWPDLTKLEESVREQISSEQETLIAAVKDPRASVIDLGMTRVVDGDLIKILSWYDNEWGFTNQMVRQAQQLGQATAVIG